MAKDKSTALRYGVEIYRYTPNQTRVYLCWGIRFWQFKLPF